MIKLKKVFILVVVFFGACSWFIPFSIKREITYVKLDVNVSFSQMEELKRKSDLLLLDIKEDMDTEAKVKQYEILIGQYKKISEQLINSYKRVLPHLDNLENFIK